MSPVSLISAMVIAVSLGGVGMSASIAEFTPEREITVTLPGGARMEFRWIEPGSFTMGSPASESGRLADEGPQHEVTITDGFYLGKFEITQAQWESVMGTASTEKWHARYVQLNPDHPSVYISWEDVHVFVKALNRSALNKGAKGALYRLPTEAEWEYAARAGTTTRWSFGDDEDQLGKYTSYGANTWSAGLKYAQPVGTRLPNRWGLHDMHGNVWEWVQDWYSSEYYSSADIEDPTGPAAGDARVMRGGGFSDVARGLRSACRFRYRPGGRGYSIGARLLRTR